MSVRTQYEFVWGQLKASARSVGIDIEKSCYGLLEIFNQAANHEMELEPEDLEEAERLLKEYGSTEEGLELLYSLGEACLFGDGYTWAGRDFEPKWNSENELKALGWDSLEVRALCDFAMFTGIAASRCQSYSAHTNCEKKESIFSELGRKGAVIRHAPMMQLRAWAIEKYKAGDWQSANQAAHALKESVIKHGRTINAHLSEENAQRTIAEWFRKSV